MQAAPARCLGQFELSREGRLEGWCWLPDAPQHRAVVDILVDDQPTQSVIATRLRPELRDLGFGDGYHGFEIPLLREAGGGVRRIEARERSRQCVFGRVLLGAPANPRGERMADLAARFAACGAALTAAGAAPAGFAETFGVLGRALLHRRARPGALENVALAACLRRLAVIPPLDIRTDPQPRTSVLLLAMGPIAELVDAIRRHAGALPGAEFLLLDNGTHPDALLLPTRLRGLRVVRTEPAQGLGALLNAGCCAARGDGLVVLTEPSRGPTVTMAREAFRAVGGFREDGDAAIWSEFAGRAQVLGLNVNIADRAKRFREVREEALLF